MSDYDVVSFNESHVLRATEIYNYYVRTSTTTFDLYELSEDEFRKRIVAADPPYGTFAVVNKATDQVVGYTLAGVYKTRPAYGKCSEVSVYIDPEYVGRGLGTIALEVLHNFARSQGLHTLLGGICTESIDSIRLFEKMGYERVAHLKEVGWKFNRWLDIYFYEKILD